MQSCLNSNRIGSISSGRWLEHARHRFLVAILVGGLSGFGFAPYFMLPLAYFGLCALALMIRQSRSVFAAFLVGWAFGLGQFIVGLNWITESFAVEAERFGVLAWPAVIVLSAFLAVFPAIAAMAARCLGGRSSGALIVLPATWTMAEMVRGAILTGFPWNLIGYIWGFSDEILQTVSVVGIYGLGLFTLLAATMPVLLIGKLRLGILPAALVFVLTPLVVFAVLWSAGKWRLDAADVAENGERVRIVQPNIPQTQKWEPSEARGILEKLHALGTSGDGSRPLYVIWPETAYPFLFETDREIPPILLAAIPSGGLLITGAVREVAGRSPEDPALLNSLLALDDKGGVIADYDKVRLVPFGEFTPFKSVLGAMKMTIGDIDYSPGRSDMPIQLAGLPAARILICYEAIFPRVANDNARWILNITNDAWFGLSAGPYQHFLAARVRAIEAGLPLIRAANSGISAIVDGYGRVKDLLPLNVSGVIDGALPAPVKSEIVFVRLGNKPLVAIMALLVAAGAVTQRGSGRNGWTARVSVD